MEGPQTPQAFEGLTTPSENRTRLPALFLFALHGVCGPLWTGVGAVHVFLRTSTGDIYHYGNNQLGQSGVYIENRAEKERNREIVDAFHEPWKLELKVDPNMLSFSLCGWVLVKKLFCEQKGQSTNTVGQTKDEFDACSFHKNCGWKGNSVFVFACLRLLIFVRWRISAARSVHYAHVTQHLP